MPEENKKRIVIASILKPVNDTRMFGKIARTLASTDHYEIHISGYESKQEPVRHIHSHPIGRFSRLSLKRLLAPWHVFQVIARVRPALVIITTHELLIIALLARLFYRTRVIYDVQENYFANLYYTNTFPYGIRNVLAMYVRIKETLSAPFIAHFFLAEKAYAKELPFVKRKFTILENKVRRPFHPIQRNTQRSHITLFFSGTLAESTGVFIAIDLATMLHQENPSVRLVIIGFASHRETLLKIQQAIKAHDFIELIGGDQLVPHDEIIRHIHRADFGIIAYPDNPSTRTAIPTKLYEYLGYKLPILLAEHERWASICRMYNAAVVFSPDTMNAQAILDAMSSQAFYTTSPDGVYWESQESDLLRAVDGFSIRS